MNQRRGPERLAGLLVAQFLFGDPAQFVVDQGQQLVGGLRVAILDGAQKPGDMVHQGPKYLGISQLTTIPAFAGPVLH